MQFGVCFAPDPPPRRWVDLAKQAEGSGFDYVWMWDSHVLWQDVYPTFTLMAAATERIRMGPLVTNPVTRDPTVTASVLATLDDLSGGRMDMGLGRGDSARRGGSCLALPSCPRQRPLPPPANPQVRREPFVWLRGPGGFVL